MIDYSEIPDYRLLSCGCCTGRKTDVGPNWRTADDQCVCNMHQDVPRGRPSRYCSKHRGVVYDIDPQGAAA